MDRSQGHPWYEGSYGFGIPLWCLFLGLTPGPRGAGAAGRTDPPTRPQGYKAEWESDWGVKAKVALGRLHTGSKLLSPGGSSGHVPRAQGWGTGGWHILW